MNRIRPLVLLGAAAAVGLSCGKATQPDPLVPTTVSLDQTQVAFDALTATAQLTATVLDQNGQAMSGQSVTWSTNAPGVASVSSAGLVTAVGNGTATVTATAGNASGTAAVSVTQVVTSLEKVSGDTQTGTVATPLPQPLVVLAKDRLGRNVAGGAGGQVANVNVQFAVTGGGGSLAQMLAPIGSNGQASTMWTLGNAPGANTASAAIVNGPSVSFSATGELGPPSGVSVQAGDAQTVQVGTAVPVNPSVQVNDVGGNPLQSVQVAFVITQGPGGSLTGDTVLTDAAGLATVGSWTLDTTAGPNTLEARVGTITRSFSATGTAGPATAVAIFEGNNQSTVASGTLAVAPAVQVLDQYNNPVAGVSVDFVVTLGGGSVTGTPATTDAAGIGRVGSWTLGPMLGPNSLDATVASVGTVTFNATAVPPTPDSVAVFDGDNQIGLVGFAVNVPPAAKVFDAAGNPFSGATVNFAVQSGGGSVTGGTVVTGADGIARVGSWTLGGSTGSNTITATVQSMNVADNPVTFTATGEAASHTIEIRYLSGTSPTATQQAAFDSAVARWGRIIFRDVADVAVNVPANACISGQPALNETIDDIVVFVEFAAIDGSGNTLAQAGHCDNATNPLRSTDSLPLLGILRMDTADLPSLESSGQLADVVTHELGHAIGFNRGIFGLKGFLQNPSITGGAGVDTHFDGPEAVKAMNANGGTNYMGAKVPVENNAVSGQADSHWRESVFDAELMTPFSESPGTMMPLSRVTAAAMLDLRYGVNLSGAATIDLGFGLSAGPRIKLSLGRDVLFVDLAGTGATGRTLR